jgi:hypothetical protein
VLSRGRLVASNAGDSFYHEPAAPMNGERATTTARLPLVGEVFRWEAAH